MQNTEVMKLVANGGRLGQPPGCPELMYLIMADCWNPEPEHRPNFQSILERMQALLTVSISRLINKLEVRDRQQIYLIDTYICYIIS